MSSHLGTGRQSLDTRTCDSCEAAFEAGSKFCSQCGTRLVLQPATGKAPVSQEEPAPSQDQCAHCGEPLERFDQWCPNCLEPRSSSNIPPQGTPLSPAPPITRAPRHRLISSHSSNRANSSQGEEVHPLRCNDASRRQPVQSCRKVQVEDTTVEWLVGTVTPLPAVTSPETRASGPPPRSSAPSFTTAQSFPIRTSPPSGIPLTALLTGGAVVLGLVAAVAMPAMSVQSGFGAFDLSLKVLIQWLDDEDNPFPVWRFILSGIGLCVVTIGVWSAVTRYGWFRVEIIAGSLAALALPTYLLYEFNTQVDPDSNGLPELGSGMIVYSFFMVLTIILALVGPSLEQRETS